jgi:hypothetical protein
LSRLARNKNRPQRIAKIATKLADRFERQRQIKTGDEAKDRQRYKRPLKRAHRVKNPKVVPIIAYDFETTSIKKGTPEPLYLTACGKDYFLSTRIKENDHLALVLSQEFLTLENNGCRFVAWNGNKYDAYFIAMALAGSSEYIIKPYLTKSKQLRGLKVISVEHANRSWEFLDGIAMTGLVGVSLDKFLKTFAPEYLKLEAPDWETQTFNYRNKKHVEYAERDSEGLYHGLMRAQDIMLEHFSVPLQVTIGRAGIKIFQQYIPSDVQVHDIPYSSAKVIRDHVMRGGYCYCAKKYDGPVWKYDINQAYAAAMRETWLPEGRCFHVAKESGYTQCGVYLVIANSSAVSNPIPFYCTDFETGRKIFAVSEFKSWITTQEIKQLRAEGWLVEIQEGYAWESAFKMSDYVNTLENLRVNNSEGPKGAQGTMVKAIGNNSYGKTVERLDGLELVFSVDKPDGYSEYLMPDDAVSNIWFRIREPQIKSYHQPQIGAFITAHVRMVLRRAIMLNRDDWLYADTDCTIFSSKPVGLDIDSSRYGAWKVEETGSMYRIIDKKVYANHGATEKHSKGLNVSRLTDDDFIAWYNGIAPVQDQIQRQNFTHVLSGRDMFVERTRRGSSKNQTQAESSRIIVTRTSA